MSDRTVSTLVEWLQPARDRFGTWTLRELEGAADDVARWRARLPTEHGRYKHTRALRQVLEGARRWRYISRNPAVEAGPNPQPRGEEVWPLSAGEIEAIVAELVPRDAAIVVFGAETGLRTNELDRDRATRRGPPQPGRGGGAPIRRGQAHALSEDRATARSRSRRAPAQCLKPDPGLAALLRRRARSSEADKGGHLNLNNWRNRIWNPALEAAGVDTRGPYSLRHTFATNALGEGRLDLPARAADGDLDGDDRPHLWAPRARL